MGLGKSGFFHARRGFEYGYGVGFRGKSTSNLGNYILKAVEGFETPKTEKRQFGHIFACSSIC